MAIWVLSKEDILFFQNIEFSKFNIIETVSKKWGSWHFNIGFTFINESKYCSFKCDSKEAFMIGTPLYKKTDYKNVLDKIANDYFSKKLNFDDLQGNYLLAFYDGNNIVLVTDKTGQQSLFLRTTDNVISSSFLNLIMTSVDKLTVNKLALKEKVLIGYNIGEETIVNEVLKISDKHCEFLKNQGIDFQSKKVIIPKFEKIDSNNLVENQIIELSNFFENIDSSFKNEKGDLGLSGGFDCRLVLSLAKQNISKKLHLHSHMTKGVHESEINIALKLGDIYGEKIHTVPTTKISELSENEIERVLLENIYLFDGRSARHLGAYSPTYTYDYKKKSQGDSLYSLNGLGGEIFRDSYFIGNKKMNWKDWANRFLYLQLGTEILSSKSFNEVDLYLKKKLSEYFDLNNLDIQKTHAYYGLIKMPQCNGNLVSAYSKISPFLTPFFEYSIVNNAISVSKNLGVGGKFQALMLTKIDQELASVNSNYGGNFTSLGLKYFVWAKLKTMGSISSRTKLVNNQLLKKENSKSHLALMKHIDNNRFLDESKKILLQQIPDLDFNKAILDSTQTRNIIFTMTFLKIISDKIKTL